jgi:hypothetical protein
LTAGSNCRPFVFASQYAVNTGWSTFVTAERLEQSLHLAGPPE